VGRRPSTRAENGGHCHPHTQHTQHPAGMSRPATIPGCRSLGQSHPCTIDSVPGRGSMSLTAKSRSEIHRMLEAANDGWVAQTSLFPLWRLCCRIVPPSYGTSCASVAGIGVSGVGSRDSGLGTDDDRISHDPDDTKEEHLMSSIFFQQGGSSRRCPSAAHYF
jgi:hypothetical protein